MISELSYVMYGMEMANLKKKWSENNFINPDS